MNSIGNYFKTVKKTGKKVERSVKKEDNVINVLEYLYRDQRVLCKSILYD